MSVNSWKVYMKCPKCGKETYAYDYHENTSSDNTEIFEVLNIGKQSNHIWIGNPMSEPMFRCPFCQEETSYDTIFSNQYCHVESLAAYKDSLIRHIHWADKSGKVSFSDWVDDWDEEPALSRLMSIYPQDSDLKRIKRAYHSMHSFGKKNCCKS